MKRAEAPVAHLPFGRTVPHHAHCPISSYGEDHGGRSWKLGQIIQFNSTLQACTTVLPVATAHMATSERRCFPKQRLLCAHNSSLYELPARPTLAPRPPHTESNTAEHCKSACPRTSSTCIEIHSSRLQTNKTASLSHRLSAPLLTQNKGHAINFLACHANPQPN